MRVGISHISNEGPIARMIRDWIETSFAGRFEVFLCGNNPEAPFGARWLASIESDAGLPELLIVLCSPASTSNPGFNFEMGCAWTKGIRMLPVYYGGLLQETAQPPFSSFRGLDAEDPRFSRDLLIRMAQEVGIGQLPRIAFGELQAELATILERFAPGEDTTSGHRDRYIPNPKRNRLDNQEEQILIFIGHSEGRDCLFETLLEQFSCPKSTLRYHLDELVHRRLIYPKVIKGQAPHYLLNHEGRQYLLQHRLI